tara:strand:- start:2323 stop:3978 length:1656 start_codon:yes stop_codon:yes gene_type:complete
MTKYQAFPLLPDFNRNWPNRRITSSPTWCSVDLRDGNQALINPMSIDEKCRFFTALVKMGFKEIEVGFPSAAEVEYDFLRKLVDDQLIPDDVSIQVLCQAREHLIEKTMKCLKGVKNVIFHLYNSTSIQQRKIVFNRSKKEIVEIALNGINWIKNYQNLLDDSVNFTLQYSPESFTGTELEFSLEICEAVMEEWLQNNSNTNKVILNLPATVELSTPNLYADMIECFIQNLKDPSKSIISLHTHNDRGTGVAATELGLLAGASRVEGTLFGNGERTGNVDIVTLALNLLTQGINPDLDISDINQLAQLSVDCTEIPIHPRHPYVGELVYTAFSGSHQDAIKKGMAYQKEKSDPLWEVPYLPIDPEDVGRSYEAIIRINSQSGKGGAAFILENEFGCSLPKDMHPEFGQVVQKKAEETGQELSTDAIWALFDETFIKSSGPYVFKSITFDYKEAHHIDCSLSLNVNGVEKTTTGTGNGPINACKNALNDIKDSFELKSYHEHSLNSGSASQAICYIQAACKTSGTTKYGVGIDENISIASVKALFNALNRIS